MMENLHIFEKIQKAAGLLEFWKKLLLFRPRKQKWLEVDKFERRNYSKIKGDYRTRIKIQ